MLGMRLDLLVRWETPSRETGCEAVVGGITLRHIVVGVLMLLHPWLRRCAGKLRWHVGMSVRPLCFGQLGRVHGPELCSRGRPRLHLLVRLWNGDARGAPRIHILCLADGCLREMRRIPNGTSRRRELLLVLVVAVLS